MARGWISKLILEDDDDDDRRKSRKGSGRRRGEADHDESKNASKDPKNQPQVATHQTYLDARGGAKVAYVNCYCNAKDDHSRGTY
jgi:hypothetical protein